MLLWRLGSEGQVVKVMVVPCRLGPRMLPAVHPAIPRKSEAYLGFAIVASMHSSMAAA